jgi:hypothetical protein
VIHDKVVIASVVVFLLACVGIGVYNYVGYVRAWTCMPDFSRVSPTGQYGSTCDPLQGTTVPGPTSPYYIRPTNPPTTPQATP